MGKKRIGKGRIKIYDFFLGKGGSRYLAFPWEFRPPKGRSWWCRMLGMGCGGKIPSWFWCPLPHRCSWGKKHPIKKWFSKVMKHSRFISKGVSEINSVSEWVKPSNSWITLSLLGKSKNVCQVFLPEWDVDLIFKWDLARQNKFDAL